MPSQPDSKPRTLGELRKSGYVRRTVKEEIRRNLVKKIRSGEPLFPDIVGYEKTVIPAIVNALLSRHDFILLGLRGQAKTRILRELTGFLDDHIPAVTGCQINDDPTAPLCKRCRTLVESKGDATPITWLSRDERYAEKLATPDVAIADLIGDIDPIKAANEKLTLADEQVIHFGILPRTNRGIFAINELPDLNARIQVGLLNIMEERDVQIRGFPVRLPLDLLLVFTANPEDYTNRGTIITPLKDRIDSQILTHYPTSVDDAVRITEQEAWIKRGDICDIWIPPYIKELVETVSFEARKSEFVDQTSGVSARVSISAMEHLISNMERRALLNSEKRALPRLCDIYASLPALTGKIELVYEGEQQGVVAVAKRIIGNAVNKVFSKFYPNAYKSKTPKMKKKIQVSEDAPPADDDNPYKEIIGWFARGNMVDITDTMSTRDYVKALERVDGLKKVALQHMKPKVDEELPLCMELLLEGLYQNSLIAKEELETSVVYKDILKTMFESIEA